MAVLMRFFHVAGDASQAPATIFFGPGTKPDYAPGDRRYLPKPWTHYLQLRPLVTSDMVHGVSYPPGVMMLVFHRPELGTMRFFLHVAPEHRDNTSENADAVWARARNADPTMEEIAKVLESKSPPSPKRKRRRKPKRSRA